MKNLLYFCIFYNEKYLILGDLLLKSLSIFGKIDKSKTDILLCTSREFMEKFKDNKYVKELGVKFFVFEANNLYEACSARLNIFNYEKINDYNKILFLLFFFLSLFFLLCYFEEINVVDLLVVNHCNYPFYNYNKILYIDTDILITDNLNNIFNKEINKKLYAKEEAGSRKWHYFLWHKSKIKWLPKDSFSTGVLLFLNCPEIKELFSKIYLHIKDHIKNKKKMPSSVDQPFIIYHCYQKKCMIINC